LGLNADAFAVKFSMMKYQVDHFLAANLANWLLQRVNTVVMTLQASQSGINLAAFSASKP